MIWQTSRFSIDLAEPRVMGIVNVTPDSFSDGGRHGSTAAALRHCEHLLRDGAHILDLGADIINDIWALRQPGAAEVVASHPQCGVCLMHMHRDPQTMQVAPMEGDVVQQVLYFLQRSALDLQALGVEKNRIVLDPGIGFGKTVEQNFALLAHQSVLRAAGYPLLAGWSRKSSLGAVTGLAVEQRMVPSVAAAVLAVERGASVVRVHDVRETVAALAVWRAMQGA